MGDKKAVVVEDIGEKDHEKVFYCNVCTLEEIYDYFGTEPPFTKPIRFEEKVYVMKDPFSPHRRGVSTNFVLLGSHCSKCNNTVCSDQSTCSIFYGRRYCRDCVSQSEVAKTLPAEVQREMKRMLANKADLSSSPI